MPKTPNRPWSVVYDDELKLMRRIVGLAAGSRLACITGIDPTNIDDRLDLALHDYTNMVDKGRIDLLRMEIDVEDN